MDKAYFDKIAEYGQLIIVSGPNGVGKRTIIKEYIKDHPNAIRCVSVTTRPQRDGEVDGQDYYFISHKEFNQLVRSNQMLEYGYLRRNGYGTIRSAVEQLRAAGRNVILDIDVVGAMKVRTIYPDATLIFILPPTWGELERRIRDRRAESEEVIAELLLGAQEEVLCADQYDYVLINDTIEATVRRLAQIVHGNRYSRNSMRTFLQSYIESEISSSFVDEIRSI